MSETPTRAGVARAVSWMGVGHVASQGLWLGSLILLAALVEPSAFGSLAIGMVLVNLAGCSSTPAPAGASSPRPCSTARRFAARSP